MVAYDLAIQEIYADCFIGTSLIPFPVQYKINITLGSEWCVGDKVHVSCQDGKYDEIIKRYEAKGFTIKESDFEPEPGVCYKPVIYLYPEQELNAPQRTGFTVVEWGGTEIE